MQRDNNASEIKKDNNLIKERIETFLIVGLANPGKEYKNTRHNIGGECIIAYDKLKCTNKGNKNTIFVDVVDIRGNKIIKKCNDVVDNKQDIKDIKEDDMINKKNEGDSKEDITNKKNESDSKEDMINKKNEGDSKEDDSKEDNKSINITEMKNIKDENKGTKNNIETNNENTKTLTHTMIPNSYMNNSGIPISQKIKELGITPQNLIVVHDDVHIPFGKIKLKKGGSSGGHNGIQSIIENIGSNFIRVKVGVAPIIDTESKTKIERIKGEDLIDFVLGTFSQDELNALKKIIPRICDAIDCIINDGLVKATNIYHAPNFVLF